MEKCKDCEKPKVTNIRPSKGAENIPVCKEHVKEEYDKANKK